MFASVSTQIKRVSATAAAGSFAETGLGATEGGEMATPRRDFWTPTAGILAAITFVVGLAMSANSPDSDDTDAQIISWYADHGHRVGVIVGAFVLAFCGLFLLWFAAGLRQRLRLAEGPDGRLANVALGGAVLLVALLWVGAAAFAAVPGGVSLGGATELSNADVARFVPSAGFASILIFGMFGAIALIDATSIVIMRTGVLPRWLGWLGFVCGVVLLFAVVFLPVIALPIWLIAASIVLYRQPVFGPEG
jgi:MFS family permease